MMRTEFGVERSSCNCDDCLAACKVMPGFLIPSDLQRLVPQEGRERYILDHFEASDGAVVYSRAHGIFTVKTIVPALRHGCVFLKDNQCTI